VERIEIAPVCESVLSLQDYHSNNVCLVIRAYDVTGYYDAAPKNVLQAYIDSLAFRDDMIGPGFQLNTERDVHGPFLASYVSIGHYEPISHDRLRELLEERIRTPFWDDQEQPSMPEDEREAMEEALSKIEDFRVYRLALEHPIEDSKDSESAKSKKGSTPPKHDRSDILWEYQEYVAIPEPGDAHPRGGMYTFTVMFD
jgi:hypothetical protein